MKLIAALGLLCLVAVPLQVRSAPGDVISTTQLQKIPASRRWKPSDIAGDYTALGAASTVKNLHISVIHSYALGRVSQCDFIGTYGKDPIVGQATISGDEGYTDTYLSFSFMYLELQDATITMDGGTLMRNGKVVGLRVTTSGGDWLRGIAFKKTK